MAHSTDSRQSSSGIAPVEECTTCGRDVTRLDMVRNGLELEFVSCSTCDTRVWMRDGEPVDLDEMLAEMIARREAGAEEAAAEAQTPPAAETTTEPSTAPDLTIREVDLVTPLEGSIDAADHGSERDLVLAAPTPSERTETENAFLVSPNTFADLAFLDRSPHPSVREVA